MYIVGIMMTIKLCFLRAIHITLAFDRALGKGGRNDVSSADAAKVAISAGSAGD